MKNKTCSALALFCALGCGAPDMQTELDESPAHELQASCDQQALEGCESGLATVVEKDSGIVCECTPDLTTAESEPIDPSGEIGQLEQGIIYNSTWLHDGYGVEHPSPWRCVWPWETCRVPKYKTIKVRIMPHDYAGCWGQFWTDAINAAVNGWNAHHAAFNTGFYLQKVTSGEHAKLYCDAAGISEAGKTNTNSIECSSWCWNGFGWTECGLCKGKSWTVRLGGNNLVGSGCEYDPDGGNFCAENIMRHELGHLQGLAHHTGTSVMGSWAGGASGVFTQIQFPSLEESEFLRGFCPGSPTYACGL